MVSTTLSLLTTLLLAGVTSVRAHGHVVTWNVNGQDHAGFNPSWPPDYGPTANRPTDNRDQGWANQWTGIVACGGWGAGENVQTWDVQEGSTVTAVWDQWPHGHTGPVMEYMARCPDSGCDGVDAWTLNWFKISEAGWDGNSWPSDEITRTHRWSFQIPTGLAAGNYLVRHEIIAMHEVGAPQIYPVCFQANLAAGPGGVIPTDTVTFPDAYNQHDDFRRFNLYWGDDFNAFHNPGPAVWNGRGESGGGGSPAPSSAAPAPSSTGRGDSAPTAAPSASEGSSSEGGGGRGGGGRGGGRGGNRGGNRGGDRWNNGNNDNQEEEWQPTRTLVTSNAMATGKRPSGEGGQKFCRRRQPAKRAAVPQLLSDEALAEREMAYAKRQHVANRYSKRSLRH